MRYVITIWVLESTNPIAEVACKTLAEAEQAELRLNATGFITKLQAVAAA
jgi:hypothetical protein